MVFRIPPPHIADLFSSKFAGILNKHSSPSPNHLVSQIQSSLSSSLSEDLCFTEDDITEAICRLKSKKSGTGCVTSEHLKFSHTVIALPLSQLFIYFNCTSWTYAIIIARFDSCSSS